MFNADELEQFLQRITQRSSAVFGMLKSNMLAQYRIKDRLVLIFETSQWARLLILMLRSYPFSSFSLEEIAILKSFTADQWSTVKDGQSIFEKIQAMGEQYTQYSTSAAILGPLSTLLENHGRSDLAAKIVWPYMSKLRREPNPDLHKEIFTVMRTYLADYWQRINVGYFTYTSIPTSPLTSSHIELANLLFKVASADPEYYNITEDDRRYLSLMTFLMPGVSTESIKDEHADLAPKSIESMSTLLKTHIMSENGFYLIPVNVVQSLLNYKKEADEPEDSMSKRTRLIPPTDPSVSTEVLDICYFEEIPNPYFDYKRNSENNSSYLTMSETTRLRNFSKQTTELFIMHEQYLALISKQSHLLGQCRILAERLLQNGKNGTGSIEESGVGAEAAIHAFLDFYEKLTIDDSILPPTLIKEITFLRRCIRRCHPDEPVIPYAATCTDASYQRILMAITGHEAILASISLDAASEDYRKIVADTKHRLVDCIRKFTPEAIDPKTIHYDRFPIRSSHLLDTARELVRLLGNPATAADPNLLQNELMKILMPSPNFDFFVNILLAFNASELKEFSENATVSRVLEDLMERMIQNADDWLRLLTFISPEKITILHSPGAVKKIVQNIGKTPGIKLQSVLSNLFHCLVTVKQNALRASLQAVILTLLADKVDDNPTNTVFSQSEIETLDKLLSLREAPASEEYHALRAKIKTLCDNPDFARSATFTGIETVLMRLIFNHYESSGLFKKLESYFTAMNTMKLAETCAILIKFDILNPVTVFFRESVLRSVLFISSSAYSSNLRQNFYRFLCSMKSLLDEVTTKKFLSILQDTSPTWMRYVSSPYEATSIVNIFSKHKEMLSTIFKDKFEACASHNSAQIKVTLLQFSTPDRESYFDRHRVEIVKSIKGVPDFLNIYACFTNDPSRNQPLFKEFCDKFCEFTVTYRHLKQMAENLSLDHLKEYLIMLAPNIVEMLTRANISGQQRKPMFNNVSNILKSLGKEEQRAVINFLIGDPSVRVHLIQNLSEAERTAGNIQKVLDDALQPLFKDYLSSLKTVAAPNPFSFFGQSAASSGAGAASATSSTQPSLP